MRAVHAKSGGTYGGPRIHATLRNENIRVSKRCTERLMRELGLVGVAAKSFLSALKTQPVRRERWPPNSELRVALFHYVEVFYTRERQLRADINSAQAKAHYDAASAPSQVSTELRGSQPRPSLGILPPSFILPDGATRADRKRR